MTSPIKKAKQWSALARSITIYRRERVPFAFKVLVVFSILNALTCTWVVLH